MRRRRPPQSDEPADRKRPDWETDGASWPNRNASRFVRAAGLKWHVQEMGCVRTDRPQILLLHGTGAATHSWRDLMPILARDAHVIAVDLPGHGFTDNPGPSWLAIDAMSKSLVQLLDTIDAKPDVGIGHSAGAALLVRMALDGLIAPRGIVSINGALMPFGGIGRTLFPSLARLLFLNPFAPRLFARQARDRARVQRLLDGTGSKLRDHHIDQYWSLMRTPDHISGALGMMANWDLEALIRDLPSLRCELCLIAADGDKTVPPTDAVEVQKLYPRATTVMLDALGHLAHEEAPQRVADCIAAAMRQWRF
ncbi:MAG: alpha/beta fold hydrolase BchO [Pseudomonadota bacterium]